MDSFEFNKIAMSVLGTIFLVMGLDFVSDGLFHSEIPQGDAKGYAIEIAEAPASDAPAEDTGPAYEAITPLLASANPDAGETGFRKCAACHTYEEGGASRVGPNLYNIVNREIASMDGFGYSSALTEYGQGKQWTYEELNGFLWNPKKHIKGTSMGFAGLKKEQDRADLVAWLRTLSADPAPLPAEGESPAADAGEGTTETAIDTTGAGQTAN